MGNFWLLFRLAQGQTDYCFMHDFRGSSQVSKILPYLIFNGVSYGLKCFTIFVPGVRDAVEVVLPDRTEAALLHEVQQGLPQRREGAVLDDVQERLH